MRESIHVDDLEVIEVASGITRRTLTTTSLARAWLIDFAPGSQWPSVDHHEHEERYYVLEGEIMEGDQRYPAGSYVTFDAGSSHRPGSETGARILGINLA
jgi:quercetin dioxygenase-like cupin family protein